MGGSGARPCLQPLENVTGLAGPARPPRCPELAERGAVREVIRGPADAAADSPASPPSQITRSPPVESRRVGRSGRVAPGARLEGGGRCSGKELPGCRSPCTGGAGCWEPEGEAVELEPEFPPAVRRGWAGAQRTSARTSAGHQGHVSSA